jgi:plasmid stabilization system protein ParE
MEYSVVLADSAETDANALYARVVAAAPLRGPVWFEELLECLYSLRTMPHRCPLAREARHAHREIRCLLFGKRRNVYRILYEIDEARQTVWILHIRHGAMRDMAPGQIAKASAEPASETE